MATGARRQAGARHVTLTRGGQRGQVTRRRACLPAPKFSQCWASQGLNPSPQMSAFRAKAKATTPLPAELSWKQSPFNSLRSPPRKLWERVTFSSGPSAIYSFQPSVTKTASCSCVYCAHKPLLGLGKSEPVNPLCKAYGRNS